MTPAAPTATLLTVDTVAAYVSDRADEIGVFNASTELTAKAIMGGNVNYAFCVSSGGKAIFVKQAPEYVATFGPNGLPLSSDRMQKEYDVYMEWGRILGGKLRAKYLPTLYLFDDVNKVFVMEFFDGFTLLDHDLVEKGVVPASIAKGLGDFMGKTHAATHCSNLSSETKQTMISEYENRAMRDIQLEFVFTKCYKEATDEQLAGLEVDDAFMKEIETLKAQYDGESEDNLALCHGDLHPGSVMVNDAGEVKVIDPEFTVYSSPGLDVGSLLSGYVLAAVHQAFSDHPDAVKSLTDTCVAVWEAYKQAMLDGGISEDVIKKVEVESVGFTVAEVCRTALGFAGGRLWLQFEDASVKKASIRAAMHIVGKCMTGRHTYGIQQMFTEIEAITK